MLSEVERANPSEVDREAVISLGDCENCGPKTLASVKVEDAVYIASCSNCDYELRAPVVEKNGEHKVKMNHAEVSGVE